MTSQQPERVVFSGHAVKNLFAREISQEEVHAVLVTGEPIAEYPDDKPFPSQLLLAVVNHRPLHVVVAYDETTAIVVTAYQPDPSLWSDDFRTRRRL